MTLFDTEWVSLTSRQHHRFIMNNFSLVCSKSRECLRLLMNAYSLVCFKLRERVHFDAERGKLASVQVKGVPSFDELVRLGFMQVKGVHSFAKKKGAKPYLLQVKGAGLFDPEWAKLDLFEDKATVSFDAEQMQLGSF